MGPSDRHRSKTQRKVTEKSRKKKKSKKTDYDSSSSDEMDLKKELHPIKFYVDDRKEMLRQVFKVIRGSKLQAMLTSQLRGIELSILKRMCLEQLEGMSKKRIIAILNGEDMDESSDTSDDSDEELSVTKVNAIPKESRIEAFAPSKETSTSSKSIETTKKPSKDSVKRAPSPKDKKTSIIPDPGHVKDNMDLLELEMRARAIKSFLQSSEKANVNKDPVGKCEPANSSTLKEPKEVDIKKTKSTTPIANVSEITINVLPPEIPKEVIKEKALEDKKLQKAREELFKSEAKKREDDEAKARKENELRKRIEEQQKREKAAQEKQAVEDEKARKKAKKQADYEMFLKWKEEKRQKEAEAKQTKENLKNKEEKMKSEETKDKTDRELMVKNTSLIKRKIDRISVEDDTPYGEDITISKTTNIKKRRYRKKGEDEDGEVSDTSTKSLPCSKQESPRSSTHSRSSMSDDSQSDDTPSLSESDTDTKKSNQEREMRLRRVQAIKDRKRRKKRESEIEDGEVDSDGESFAVLANNLASLGQEPKEKTPEVANTQENVSHDDDFHDLSIEFEVQLEPDSSDTDDEGHPSLQAEKVEPSSEITVDVNPCTISKGLAEQDTNDIPEELTKSSPERKEPDRLKDDHDDIVLEESTPSLEADDDKAKSIRMQRLMRIKEFQAKTEIINQVDEVEDAESESETENLPMSSSTLSRENSQETEKGRPSLNQDIKIEVKTMAGGNSVEHAKKFRRNVKNLKSSEKVTTKSLNKDQPTKQEVDDAQEETMATWADRWLQDDKVQKVVKDSKLLNKARSNIKVKKRPIIEEKKPTSTQIDESGGEPENVHGSMEEYAMIVGKSVQTFENKANESGSSSDEENDDEDDLWGDILGKS